MSSSTDATVRVLAQTDKSAAVLVTGEIDINTASLLRTCLNRCLADGCTDVVLHVGEMTFIDSSGLAVLVSVTKQLQTRGGRVALKDPSPMAVRVLDISGLSPFIGVIDGSPPELPEDQREPDEIGS